MELRPRPFAEALRKDCDFGCAKLAASDIGAEYAKLVETCVETNQCVGCTDCLLYTSDAADERIV